ncbi:hypothetical protein BX265_4413 [Streptomyces sp. TLI_235]|nr:hypothetical protein [Streptomyces sp. TLI_235]PBC79603.1 hypothetical protein BX265_4413 [Streptomyces sp. TLI_235]
MRSGLVQIGAWAVATGAAVALSWYGVHTVLTEAGFERPQAVPLPSATAEAPASLPAATSAAATGEPVSPSPSPSSAPPSLSAAPTLPSPIRTASPVKSASPSSVRSYLVPGGRVALDIHPDQAELVSATPDAGWQMQVWNGDHWMRIDFSKDDKANSVFVTWNGHPPDVQTVVR